MVWLVWIYELWNYDLLNYIFLLNLYIHRIGRGFSRNTHSGLLNRCSSDCLNHTQQPHNEIFKYLVALGPCTSPNWKVNNFNYTQHTHTFYTKHSCLYRKAISKWWTIELVRVFVWFLWQFEFLNCMDGQQPRKIYLSLIMKWIEIHKILND